MAEESRMQFTPAQGHAIAARGQSLLVSAAAGSGKTRVLVERVVGLITDPDAPVEADSLLIVTFTNAAAAKLRSDVTQRLAQVVAEQPGNRRLRRQQLRLQRAFIGTVDAFCLHFVREHFSALGLPPDVEVADDATIYRLQQETLAATLETAYGDPDFRSFADLYDRGRSDDTAAATILSLYSFLCTLPYPEEALRQFIVQWQSDTPVRDTLWGKSLLHAAAARCAAIRNLLQSALQTAQRDPAASAALSEALCADLANLNKVQAAVDTGDWDAAHQNLSILLKWTRAKSVRGGKENNEAAALAGELRDMAKKHSEKLRDLLICTQSEFDSDRVRTAPLIAALGRAVQAYSDAFFAAKREEKALEYSDFEHLTLRLLRDENGNRTPLCQTVSARYSTVLVDEYQDTNDLQDAIYFSLARPQEDNLFFVGDIKQSIYRFRQAQPAVFTEKQKAWANWPALPGAPATIALDANFRSATAVIEGINSLLEPLFSEQLGGVMYGAGQRLVAGAPNPDYPGLCEVDVIDCTPDADCVQMDARVIAQRMADMVQEEFKVRAKAEDGGGVRPCRYEDFCILLRGRAAFPVYEQALTERGIPVYADVAGDLLDAVHIRPFASLLRVIDNPAQDVELAAVLLSPMFPFKPDDLVTLRLESPRGSLYGAILNSHQEAFLRFSQQLTVFRQLARTLPVDALIEELFARTGYLAAVGAMPDGQRCREELLQFAAWASDAGRSGLPALVRAMDAAAQGGVRPAGTGQTRPGCVTVMTVHRSKGLEFPIVFVGDTTHQFNRSDTIRPVLTHRKLGVGVTLRAGGLARRYKTLPYAAIADAIRSESLSEEMRILYVALTRARDALILTIPLKKAKTELRTPMLYARAGLQDPELFKSASGWGDWLLASVLRSPASIDVWRYVDAKPTFGDAFAPLTVRMVPPPMAVEQPTPPQPVPPDKVLLAELMQGFSRQSPRDALRDIPAKVSVTAVTQAQSQQRLERPAFMQKSGLTGAERGVAIHAFMQSVPFDRDTVDLAAEVLRQKELQLLDPLLAEKLDLDVVRPFFESSVWHRIRTAKRVMREEPFITSLPASWVMPNLRKNAKPACDAIRTAQPPDAAETPVHRSGFAQEKANAITNTDTFKDEVGQARVLVQGIADLVLVFEDHAEIVDYKTDRSTDPDYYRKEYADQLRLYRYAFSRRLSVPVTRLSLYVFSLHDEIEVPFV